MRRIVVALLMGLLLVSFNKRLQVQTRFLDEGHLASYYVGTPDPALDQPMVGQRLIITWALTKQDLSKDNVYLYLKVRLRNREELEAKVPIDRRRGYYLYDLTGEKYCHSGGILTYKVDLVGDGCVLETWTHPLWAELIRFNNH